MFTDMCEPSLLSHVASLEVNRGETTNRLQGLFVFCRLLFQNSEREAMNYERQGSDLRFISPGCFPQQS